MSRKYKTGYDHTLLNFSKGRSASISSTLSPKLLYLGIPQFKNIFCGMQVCCSCHFKHFSWLPHLNIIISIVDCQQSTIAQHSTTSPADRGLVETRFTTIFTTRFDYPGPVLRSYYASWKRTLEVRGRAGTQSLLRMRKHNAGAAPCQHKHNLETYRPWTFVITGFQISHLIVDLLTIIDWKCLVNNKHIIKSFLFKSYTV